MTVAFSSDALLALMPMDFAYMKDTGLGLFAVLVALLYIWVMRRAVEPILSEMK